MKRIHWHWTAGAYGLNDLEAEHYHFIIMKNGEVKTGLFAPEDNLPPLKPGAYAAHTLNANSHAIGIAVDAMAGAKERPFNAGSAPITSEQIEALISLTARLCLKYDIPVTRSTVLSHAEVQTTLGIKQNQKWDISWLPGMQSVGNPVKIGDELRLKVSKAIKARLEPEVVLTNKTAKTVTEKRGLLEIILNWAKSLTKKP